MEDWNWKVSGLQNIVYINYLCLIRLWPDSYYSHEMYTIVIFVGCKRNQTVGWERGHLSLLFAGRDISPGWQNVSSGEEQGEMAVFGGYPNCCSEWKRRWGRPTWCVKKWFFSAWNVYAQYSYKTYSNCKKNSLWRSQWLNLYIFCKDGTLVPEVFLEIFLRERESEPRSGKEREKLFVPASRLVPSFPKKNFMKKLWD